MQCTIVLLLLGVYTDTKIISFILRSLQLRFVVVTLSAPHHGSSLDGTSPGSLRELLDSFWLAHRSC